MLLNAVVFLTAAVICVPIAARLKLGSVLGYLAAGCIIGPFGLRLIQDPEATLHFAEIGVVLMLFVIGLELDPSHLWTLRRACSSSARPSRSASAPSRWGYAGKRRSSPGSRSGCPRRRSACRPWRRRTC